MQPSTSRKTLQRGTLHEMVIPLDESHVRSSTEMLQMVFQNARRSSGPSLWAITSWADCSCPRLVESVLPYRRARRQVEPAAGASFINDEHSCRCSSSGE